jgi:hypothetical protein
MLTGARAIAGVGVHRARYAHHPARGLSNLAALF